MLSGLFPIPLTLLSMINHRQSSTAFVCFLSGETNLVFGVHRPMLPPSIKIVRKLVELTEQYLLIMLCGYCQHFGKCHKKSEAIAQTLVFYTIREKLEKEGLGTRTSHTHGRPRVQTRCLPGYKRAAKCCYQLSKGDNLEVLGGPPPPYIPGRPSLVPRPSYRVW